jgi:hypothetical protein
MTQQEFASAKARNAQPNLPAYIDWPECTHYYSFQYRVRHRASFIQPDRLMIETTYHAVWRISALDIHIYCDVFACPHYPVAHFLVDLARIHRPGWVCGRGVTHADSRSAITCRECKTTLRLISPFAMHRMSIRTSRPLGHRDSSKADPEWVSQTDISRSYETNYFLRMRVIDDRLDCAEDPLTPGDGLTMGSWTRKCRRKMIASRLRDWLRRITR